ncbi:transposase IS4 family protein [Alicyclobacillus acidocaldarius subsp. acidocaldarius Tc-4-1]|uniref:Transposase IS4 family protein n=1 Tax=Alicyclobacillus acidocaldarius (strain Tc-4-1) TaxID=1048834 RepID=F8IKF4_ALIAT|nr:transposase IS4 family protein [Alicyclobacillus acidocaldarius subsp. acidocaldarius Tc-4-1]
MRQGFFEHKEGLHPNLRERKWYAPNHFKGAKSNVYIRQTWLFSFDEWMEIDPSERRERFFSALDLSPYAANLRSSTPKG